MGWDTTAEEAYMAQLNLGNASFITSPGRDRFAELRNRYMDLGSKHREAFQARYAEFDSADELFEQLPGFLEAVLKEAATTVASDLAANRVFDVGLMTIRSALEARAETVAGGFNRVRDRYFEIIGKAAELDAQRTKAAKSRGGIVGGGFGVEGAVQGMAIAAVANAAIGLTHGLANLTARAASSLGDRFKKRELLDDPTTKADIGHFLCRVALQGSELVAEAVNKAGGTLIFDVVSAEAEQKSAAIIENIAAERVPDPDLKAVLVKALDLDPFNGAAWRTWIDRFGDEDGSVGASADLVGIDDVIAHKGRLIAEHKGSLSWETPEQCNESAGVLAQHAARLGFPFEAERALISGRAAMLDQERRTFNGVVYRTFAEATAAREAARAAHEDELRRTVQGVVLRTHAEADETRARIRKQAVASSRFSSTLGWMTLGYRRFRDVEGRSSRKEFWMFIVFNVLVVVTLVIALAALGLSGDSVWTLGLGVLLGLAGLLFTLASIVTILTLQVRRFHDLDKSGWLVTLNLIPYIGWAIVLILMLWKGTHGDNRFGPDPLEGVKPMDDQAATTLASHPASHGDTGQDLDEVWANFTRRFKRGPSRGK